MLQEIQTLLDQYQDWLKEGTTLREVNDWVEITTPYLDRHNDRLQLYARTDNGTVMMTDDGYTIRDLELSGCTLNTPKRQELLNVVLNGFGVRLNHGNLEVSATPETFPLRKHSFVQAILAVNDLFYLAEPLVKSLFYEDVVAWLDMAEIRYTPKVKFTGKSGYDHVFDFVIPKSRRAPERILRAITRPGRDTAESLIHAWSDTRDVRPSESRAYAFLNDIEAKDRAGGAIEALKSYAIHPVAWSRREEVRAELAA
ncbi:MAG: DUF1828 domain-containing protein [Acidobacteria bacterium]|nr:DUF1828 domain-containing protein [Acidobacteriota bacterium]